jgi:hypothetical protein
MLAKRPAAAIMAMPLVSPVHTYSRPAAVLARVSYSAMLAFATLVPDNISVLLLPCRAIWAAAALDPRRVACVRLLFTFDGCGGAAFAFRRRRDMRDKASLVFVARCSDGTATLHMLLASETRQLAQRHVQRRFRQRAAAAVVAGLLAGRQLPQVSDDALGAQQVSTRELVQRSRRAAVAALLHETHTLVKHLALSSHASVF